MTAFYQAQNDGCRVTYKTGQNEIISDPLGIIFLKEQKNQISHSTEHVKQNRNYDQFFHYPAFVVLGSKVQG